MRPYDFVGASRLVSARCARLRARGGICARTRCL